MMIKNFFVHTIVVMLSLSVLNLNAQNSRVGIAQGSSIINNTTTTNRILDGMISTGAGYTRIDLDWRWIQPNGSRSFDWSVAEPAFRAALSKGLKVIALPTYSPRWANGNSDNMQSPPVNETYYYNFCYQAGLHYIPLGILDWELWNEANGGGMTVSEYVNRILKPGYNALRAAAVALGKDPNTINIITSGPQPAATDTAKKEYSQVDWVKGIYNSGGKDFFNNVGQHPYCWPFDPTEESPWNWFKKTPELYEVMRSKGDGNKKIWVTEVGWPTHIPDSGDNRGISDAKQALFLQKAYNVWNSQPWSGPFLLYNYWNAEQDPGDPEQNFGLVRHDFSAKPSLQAVKDMFAGKVWAEAGTLAGSAGVSTSGSGWTGTGYVRNLSASGNSVTINVYAYTAGTYNVAIRYSNGNSGSKTLSAYINGVDTRNISFARTGNWDTSWATVTNTFTLRAGINSVKIQFDSGDGRVDIDFIEVSRATTASSNFAQEVVEPDAGELITCYPNTFTETAKLQIDVRADGMYQVSIFNTTSQSKQILLNKALSVGKHDITFGGDLKPGIYIVELNSSSVHRTIRVVKK